MYYIRALNEPLTDMSTNYSKIYVKFGAIAITIEGDEDFVSKRFQEIFGGETSSVKKSDSNADNDIPSRKPAPQITPSLATINYNKFMNRYGTDFKNWLARLSKYASNRDKILAAAYYSQLMRSNRKFHIDDISTVMEKHGIEIRRISNFIDTFKIQGFIDEAPGFQKKQSYRFTYKGIRYVNNLYAAKVLTRVEE